MNGIHLFESFDLIGVVLALFSSFFQTFLSCISSCKFIALIMMWFSYFALVGNKG